MCVLCHRFIMLQLYCCAFGALIAVTTTTPVPNCTFYEWRCRGDGACIPGNARCDGVLDCADGSDETFVLCRNNRICRLDEFRCLYGGCVRASSVCDGVTDCVDGTDEALPKCRNQTTYRQCINKVHRKYTADVPAGDTERVLEAFRSFDPLGEISRCYDIVQKCNNGDMPKRMKKCNGKVECQDGSDETIETCAAAQDCPDGEFRCAYGACVPGHRMCNGPRDCADGSDELDELCDQSSRSEVCLLPRFPENGYYTTRDHPEAHPGLAFDTVHLNYSCHPGFKLVGSATPYCNKGWWSDRESPKCIAQCRLNRHPSVEYICLPKNSSDGGQICPELVEDGTTVRPRCVAPHYYYSGVLVNMNCEDGAWDHVTVCSPQCGLVTAYGDSLAVGGRVAERGELPWHAGIYINTSDSYTQICGGSLISTTIVVSAAHCFWRSPEGLLPAAKFGVAVGKLYPAWDSSHDDAQKSDVRDIKVTPRFQGAAANFQDDIALVIAASPFEFSTHVRPVCVDFEHNFERRQLYPGAIGKVAGWGLASEDGRSARSLQVVALPYVDIEACISGSAPTFREYITSDKICAGFNNGTARAVCKGDSGGGLAFLARELGAERYFLRGIVSTAPREESLCNAHVYTTFTQLTKHETFIRMYL